MYINRNLIIGVGAVAALIAAGGMALDSTGQRGNSAPSVANTVATLPPSEAGRPSLAGTVVTGRVSAVYVEVAKDVFMSIDRANDKLKTTAPRQVEVEFPDRLVTNDAAATAAYKSVADGGPELAIGDIVTVKFPYRDMSGLLPETTRVTQLAARKDEPLAREYQQRIAMRKALESMVAIAGAARGVAAKPDNTQVADVAGTPLNTAVQR